MRKSGQLVTPGDKLGVIEEFHPGRGTYVNDGVIYAQTTGTALIDRENKKISVFQKSKIPVVPQRGHIVLGEVQLTKDKMATIKLFKDGNSKLKTPLTAIMHVSFASKQYLASLRDGFKPGDIVLAEVIGDENQPIQLTTAMRDLGVLQAYCSKCGGILELKGRNLTCKKCGHSEKRKISEQYGKEF